MTYQIVDVPSNNHGAPIDWNAVKASGIAAVFIKATEGSGYVNPYYASDRDAARAAGLLVAAYHFADWTNVTSEVDYFIRWAGADARILDVEAGTDVGWSTTFLNALPVPAERRLGYGSLSSCINQLPALPWLAEPGASSAPAGDVALQYTWTGTIGGISGGVDVSEWTGTEAQWQTFWGTDPVANNDSTRSAPVSTYCVCPRPASMLNGGPQISDELWLDAITGQPYVAGDSPDWVSGAPLALPHVIAACAISGVWRDDGSA